VQDISKSSLKYLFFTFLKIGATSWGGFMALISIVQKQLVEKDKRISDAEILEGISLASVLPGPVAFNVVAYVGYRLRGISGALVSMAGLLIPSFLLMLLLSYFYLTYGNLPSLNHFFAGILPAVAAIILSVSFAMAKKNISDVPQIFIAVVAAIVVALSKAYFTTIILMLLSGTAGYLLYFNKSEISTKKPITLPPEKKSPKFGFLIPIIITSGFLLVLLLPLLVSTGLETTALLQQKIMLTFSGISLSLFGGGYVFIPAIQKIVVGSMNWLSSKEFADAVAMGQITPGPILISATFIGYKVAGFLGALNATISIFLPPGLLMIVCSRFFNKIRSSAIISAVFKGLRPAIIGMIAAAAFTIMMHNDITVKPVLLFCAFLILAIRYKADPVYLIPGAGVIGLLIF